MATAAVTPAAVTATPSAATTSTAHGLPAAVDAFRERAELIAQAVDRWSRATSIAEAHDAAETAANLITGGGGPGYGDRDGDGSIAGATPTGLLPSLDGASPGLASALRGNRCIDADVLGGAWDDARARWNEMAAAIEAWSPARNTMPGLASHPMRVVGWATSTLEGGSLDAAHEYAGHARIHVAITLAALDC